MDQPNPIAVAWGILRVLVGTRPPSPTGVGSVDHSSLQPVLESLRADGIPGVAGRVGDLGEYLETMAGVEPDALSRGEALAFWINLYNAGAIRLATEAFLTGTDSVLRTPGGFTKPILTISGEDLSLDAIEHAKIRRFRDPRIHGALVCGSLSCPTLRPEPYSGDDLDTQLEEQMKSFLANGGALDGGEGLVKLSRIFLWYGADFVRSTKMPTFVPTSRSKTLEAVRHWLPEDVKHSANVEFQDYDWSLGCQVR